MDASDSPERPDPARPDRGRPLPMAPSTPEHAAEPDADEDRFDLLRRREFLGLVGAGFAGLALPECSLHRPAEPIVPYLEQPEELVPGVAVPYASTCGACPAECGVLVTCRDGRPIKMEGNPEHPLSRGGLCARGQASVLDLYDSGRRKGPASGGEETTWAEVDAAVRRDLVAAARAGRQIAILSGTVTSPTLSAAIGELQRVFPTTRHYVYDPLSVSAILDAHERTHGRRVLPWYRLERARAIVGIDADFLGAWLSPVELAAARALGRRGEDTDVPAAWHGQIEARMSVTGANADQRIAAAPSTHLAIVLTLIEEIALIRSRDPDAVLPPAPADVPDLPGVRAMARRLAEAPGRSLLVCGSRDPDVQLAVNVCNELLDAYGATLDLTRPSLQLQGSDAAVDELIAAAADGRVGAVIVLGNVNPLRDHPRAAELAAALDEVDLTVSLSGRRDETSERADVVCPDHHPLEAWGDAHPHVGVYSVFQPVLAPLGDTRAAVESLLAWAGREVSAWEVQRDVWREVLFARQERHISFDAFWDEAVHDGVLALESEELAAPRWRRPEPLAARPTAAALADGELEVDPYASVALGDGRQASNPWLQELPDPITRASWGNVASVAPATAAALGLVEGRVVELSVGGATMRLPAHVQPGMAKGVVAVALGHGRRGMSEVAANYPTVKMFGIERELLDGADVTPLLAVDRVRVRLTDAIEPLAKVQRYDYQTEPFTGKTRPWARSTTSGALAAASAPAEHGEADHAEADHGGDHGEADHGEAAAGGHGGGHATLWPGHRYDGHRWGLAIDLGACTGCSACVIACQAENNVPVVGKAEVRKSRDMHWLRIDRYYDGAEDAPVENPDVVFQPMLCQHCDNAPCETVCPVLATVHSSEGLNVQVYNRCVGTRYCANNCPYKVRRFNWFDYAHDDLVQNLVLNPDVAVRTRGVMEKCSLCTQRISAGKSRARTEGREPLDGEIEPACAQTCPTEAIVFGDLNDPKSRVAQAASRGRAYHVLDELGVQPSIAYLGRVRNRADEPHEEERS